MAKCNFILFLIAFMINRSCESLTTYTGKIAVQAQERVPLESRSVKNEHQRPFVTNTNSLTENTREKRSLRAKASSLNNVKGIPDKVDWRESGVVSSIKNQKNCGACWAFSTMATVESMHAIRSGSLLDLSVQQIIDCADNGNYGCSGGDTCNVLHWMTMNNISFVAEQDYPLTDVYGTCKSVRTTGIRVFQNHTCKSYVGQEDKILELIATHGPVVVAVDATTWQDYMGGIIQYHCPTATNHAVQIVGYDLTGEVPYYIVKNSWGLDFGLDGYLYIAVGKNLCGVAERVSTLDVTC